MLSKNNPQACSEKDLPLEGAKARLEELKESLYQREREITELLGTDGVPVPPPPCPVLLPVVIQKVSSANSMIKIYYFYTDTVLRQKGDLNGDPYVLPRPMRSVLQSQRPEPGWSR